MCWPANSAHFRTETLHFNTITVPCVALVGMEDWEREPLSKQWFGNIAFALSFMLHLRSCAAVLRTLHPYQEKVVHLLDAKNVETSDICPLERKLWGEKSSECERKHNNFAPATCFTNAASLAHTLSECLRASDWRRTPISLTELKRSTEMEYNTIFLF